MSRRFEGRVCLITGSTGIAEAAARWLAAEGGSVYVVSKTADHARRLAESMGGPTAWRAADLTVEAEVDATVADCVARFGGLDCVYNVAGISARRFGDGAAHEMTLEGWETALRVNATSIFLVCRAAIRVMLERGGGAILNMGSVIAQSPEPRFFATAGYAASKGAIEGFSRSIAAYYAKDGIRVNVIAPGLVATPMSRRAQSNDELLAFMKAKQPLSRGMLVPDDLVGTALYLLSDDSRAVSGQVIAVDGGWSLAGAE